jgi:hypothetical protein
VSNDIYFSERKSKIGFIKSQGGQDASLFYGFYVIAIALRYHNGDAAASAESA